MFFTVFFHGEISVQIFLMRILRTSGRKGGVVGENKTVKKTFIGCKVSSNLHSGIISGSTEAFTCYWYTTPSRIYIPVYTAVLVWYTHSTVYKYM